MEEYLLKNAVNVSHILLEPYIPHARVLVDMTCGNGHDTVFLASRMARDASLYAFDIQNKAIASTRKRLCDERLLSDRVHLLQDRMTSSWNRYQV